MGRNEPFKKLNLLASGWGEDAPLPSGYANPSPVFISTFVVSLSLLNPELQQHRGTRPLVMDTLAELPEAQNANAMHLTHPPVRVQFPVRLRQKENERAP